MHNDDVDIVEFSIWFKYFYDGSPDPERLKALEKEAWEHVNALGRIGKETDELKRLQQAWDDSLEAWRARGKV